MTSDRVRLLRASHAGQTTAGLVFRVGFADESLPTSGITALVLSMALRGAESPGLDLSGAVGPTTTWVQVTGSDERVIAAMRDLALAFSDLPLRFRQSETRTLEDVYQVDALSSVRFGPQGYGLSGFVLGQQVASDDDLRAWALRYFTAPNAVAWIASPREPELDLPLPAGPDSGSNTPPPPVPAAVVPTRAEAIVETGEAVWDAIVPAGPAAEVLCEVARRALFENVRQEHGWSYDVAAQISQLDGRMCRVRVSANLSEDTAGAATGELLDTLGRLRFTVSDDDVDSARTHLLARFDEPDQAARWILQDAVLTALGLPVPAPEDRRAALERVTASDVVALARAAWDTALIATPVAGGWIGTRAIRPGEGALLPGTVHERRDADAAVVIGEDGVSLRDGRTTLSVRFDEVAALLEYPDGGRLVIGRNGARVPLEPMFHASLPASALDELVSARVPEEVRLARPERDVPAPATSEQIAQAKKARRKRAEHEAWTLPVESQEPEESLRSTFAGALLAILRVAGIFGAIGVGLLGGIATLVAAGATVIMATSSITGEIPWSDTGIAGLATLVCVAITWLAVIVFRRL